MTALLTDREIITGLEKIGGGDAARGLGILCVAACICPACGTSWDNPAFTCGCTNTTPDDRQITEARGNRP